MEPGNLIFSDCSFSALEIVGQGSFFSPEEIAERLTMLGAKVVQPTTAHAPEKVAPIRDDVVDLIERAVKSSERTCDVALEEISSDQKLINLSFGLERNTERFGK